MTKRWHRLADQRLEFTRTCRTSGFFWVVLMHSTKSVLICYVIQSWFVLLWAWYCDKVTVLTLGSIAAVFPLSYIHILKFTISACQKILNQVYLKFKNVFFSMVFIHTYIDVNTKLDSLSSLAYLNISIARAFRGCLHQLCWSHLHHILQVQSFQSLGVHADALCADNQVWT